MSVPSSTVADLVEMAFPDATDAPGTPPASRLEAIRALRDRLDEAERAAARACRAEGESWAQIGRRWGISRQAAHARFATISDDDDPTDPAEIEANNERGNAFMNWFFGDEGEAAVAEMNELARGRHAEDIESSPAAR